MYGGPALVDYDIRIAAPGLEEFGDLAGALPAADLFVEAEGQVYGACRLEAIPKQVLHGLQHAHQAAFIVQRAAAPDMAVGDSAGEGGMCPALHRDGHHVLVRQQQDGLFGGVAALPGVKQAVLIDDLPIQRGMDQREGHGTGIHGSV